MKYLAVLGRQPELSLAELEALFSDVQQISPNLATFTWTGDGPRERGSVRTPAPDISRLGGSLKLAKELDVSPLDYLRSLPDGKLTIGVSDYSRGASPRSATLEALKLKKILTRHHRSVRVAENKSAVISTATSLHNGLSGKNPKKCEFIKVDRDWYRVIGVQDIDAYSHRDQARPARDAKVGMLPPKLAQILINLCGPLPASSRILDPFCGTGVVLQEALLMGYTAYGTDLSPRMVEYSEKNLRWLTKSQSETGVTGTAPPKGLDLGERPGAAREWVRSDPAETGVAETPLSKGLRLGRAPRSGPRERGSARPPALSFEVQAGDATSFRWTPPIDAVACECFLGQPMSQIPPDIKLKTEMQECSHIILGFLRNLAPQIPSGTPVVIAIPAWLRENGAYARLNILDEIPPMGYNVSNKTLSGLLYFREGQIVARDIIILRKI